MSASVGTMGTLHPHLLMSSFDSGCATWNARLKVLPTALSIFFPKSRAGSGSKTEITFIFLSKMNNWNSPTISQGNKIYNETFRNA
jgi:hypothetical protein